MRKFGLLGTSALRSVAVIGFIAAGASPAFAQDTKDPPETLQSEAEVESGTNAQSGADGSQTITVTGSRIRRPNLESSVPITSIGGEEFFQQGQTNIGDTLNDLPQLRSTFGQANAGRFLGTVGLNLLDLRGLGTSRTLVLVNGRRHVAGDIRSSAASPDVNTIPNDLVERVDIVTGANSAIYGSDAIAGVVNFILRRDFEGLQVRGHASISDYGAGGNQYVSALGGMNFGDGRGNVTVHGEYARQARLYVSDIPFLRSADGFLPVDTDPGGLPAGSDGIPDRVFFRDIRTASNSILGLVPIVQPADNPATAANEALCGTGILSGTSALPYNCTFLFLENGQLVPQTGSRVGTGIIGGIVGGNGDTGRELTLLTAFPRQERYNVNLLAHFTISEAFEPFIEAKYVHVNTIGTQSSPAFIQGEITFSDIRGQPRLDNPFLPAAARTQITNAILASGFRSSLVTRTLLTPADLTAIANGSFRFVIARSTLDLGSRDEHAIRDTYRAVVGVRGTFNDDWSYEASLNYGRVNERVTQLGNIQKQRFVLALDAGIDPANPGAGIQCRSKFDPTARAPLPTGQVPNGAQTIAADIAACVPYNPFGRLSDNAAARDYIVADTQNRGFLEQKVANAFVSGDTSGFFNLPGGPIGFAVGGELRRERIKWTADPLIEGGFTLYNSLPSLNPAPRDVKEAFGELRVPLLRDVPFFEELTLSAAGRVSDYNGAIGTVYAYNAGVEWSPIRDIRFRGNYGRAVRAPGIRQTSDPLSENFTSFSDPCLPQNIANNPNRPANCAAILGANLNHPDFISLPSYSLRFKSGSNPLLTEETSDSFTVGAVIQPRFIPGLYFTADYYDIKVNNVIAAVGALQITQVCVDLPSIDNAFCKLIQRNAGPGKGPQQEVPGQILQNTLISSSVNFAALKRRGIDVEAAYRRNFGANNRFDTRLIYTHVFQNSSFVNPALPDFEDSFNKELGDPQDEFQWNVSLKLDRITFGYQMRYIGKQVVNLYEDFFELEGACTSAGCPPNNADWADIRFYPEIFYHDVRFEIEVGKDFNFYAGIDNILGTKPPLGLSGIGDGSAIYTIRGRSFFAGVKASF